MIRKRFRRFINVLASLFLVLSLFSPVALAEENNIRSTKLENAVKQFSKVKEVINKQESIRNGKPSMAASLKKVDDDDWVDVIVQLSEAPVGLEKGKKLLKGSSFSSSEENNVVQKVQSQQTKFEKELSYKKVNYRKGHTYNKVLNGVSLTIKGKDLEKLLQIDGVVRVDPVEKRYIVSEKEETFKPLMDQSVPYLEIEKLWDMGYDGEGVKVAVLDTGIDYNHPEFEGVYKGGYNFVDHSNSIYARDREDNDPYETAPADRADGAPKERGSRSFETTHGTHVAGTIAGQGNGENGFKGIAPKVDLYAYRVLGAYGEGTSDDIIAGIEKAVEEEMDIINLSLGGGSPYEYTPDAIAINNAVLSGVIAVVANGNAGPDRETVGTPATAALAISVGNSIFSSKNQDEAINTFSSRGPSRPNYDIKPDVVAPGSNILSTVAAYGKDDPNADYSKAYESHTGTSMAAPHVAAVAALLLDANPEWDPFDVKVALSNTAKLLNTGKYDVFDQGAGRVQPFEAVTAEALAYVLDTTEIDGETRDHKKGTIPFGFVSPDTTVEKTIELRNLTNQASTYEVTVKNIKTPTGVEASVSVDQSSVSLGANGKATLKVTLTAGAGQANDGDELQGYIHISNGSTELSLPFAAVFSGEQTEEPRDELGEITDVYTKHEAFSPNNDGKRDSTAFYVDLEGYHERIEFYFYNLAEEDYTGAYMWVIGRIGTGVYDLPLDGTTYFDLETGKEAEMPDGVYTIDAVSINTFTGEIHSVKESAPFVVKTTEPEISLNEVQDAEVTGVVTDQFTEYTRLIAEYTEEEVDLNEYLETTYRVTDEEGSEVESGEVTLEQDGTFAVSLAELPSGEYTLNLKVEDAALNSTGKAVAVVVEGEEPGPEPEPEPEPAPIDMSLEPTTTEPTEGSVTVKVNVASEAEIVSLKWLAGERTVEDFANAGHEIDLELRAFEVTENGTYTVYAKNSDGTEAVATITIDNIVDPEPTPEPEPGEVTITLTPSTTEPTEGPVIVTVEVESEEEIVALKWLEGKKDVGAFADAGNNIDLETKTFEVTENGDYTVYAKNSADVEAVKTISINNIVDKEDPEPTPEPKPITIELTPSTTEETEEPVTISVNVDSEEELESLKWLVGEKSAGDFADAGNPIDLTTKQFTVDKNGTYTVYAKNSAGVEAVKTITIDNIVDKQEPTPEPIPVELVPETEEETEGPVTIIVNIPDEVEVVALKWLKGVKEVEDFANAGNKIDLENRTFEVTENGSYTVYVKDVNGVESVQTIVITNITDKPEDPEGPGDPKPGKPTQPGDNLEDPEKSGDSGDDTDKPGKDGDKGKGDSSKPIPKPTAVDDGQKLPSTATSNGNIFVLGLVLVIVSIGAYIAARSIKRA